MKRKLWRSVVAMVAGLGVLVWSAEPFVLTKERRDEIRKEYGYFAVQRVEAAVRLMNRIAGEDDYHKLVAVNRFFNQVRFVPDETAWGKKDYWARPIEFLGRDQGDCEDFVIAKYFMLRKVGVAEEKLYFTYVKALKLNQAHMVLTYYETPKAVPLVLDNLNFKVLPATKRRDLAYVYSFNAQALYLNRQQGLGEAVPGGGGDRNRKWAEFLRDIEKDLL